MRTLNFLGGVSLVVVMIATIIFPEILFAVSEKMPAQESLIQWGVGLTVTAIVSPVLIWYFKKKTRIWEAEANSRLDVFEVSVGHKFDVLYKEIAVMSSAITEMQKSVAKIHGKLEKIERRKDEKINYSRMFDEEWSKHKKTLSKIGQEPEYIGRKFFTTFKEFCMSVHNYNIAKEIDFEDVVNRWKETGLGIAEDVRMYALTLADEKYVNFILENINEPNKHYWSEVYEIFSCKHTRLNDKFAKFQKLSEAYIAEMVSILVANWSQDYKCKMQLKTSSKVISQKF